MTVFNSGWWGWYKSLSLTLGPVVLILMVAWVVIRSGSGHVIFGRVWWLLHGSRQPEGRQMRTFYLERNALMKFRWITGVHARTHKRARALAAWCQENDEEISAVRACGRYFDLESPGLKAVDESASSGKSRTGRRQKLSNILMRTFLVVILIAAMLSITLSIDGMAIRGAIVKLKNGDGPWLVVYPNKVSLLWSASVVITQRECEINQQRVVKLMGLSLQDVRVVCTWFKQPERSVFISNSVREQRAALFLLFVISVLVSYFVLREGNAMVETKLMHKRLGELKQRRTDKPIPPCEGSES